MKIIAKKDDTFLIVEKDDLDLSCIFDKAYVINKKGQTVSPVLPIGTLTKDGYWESFIGDYDEYIKPDNNYVKNALIGAAVGDAFGVPYEFMSKEEIAKLELKDMIGSDIPHEFKSRWGLRIPAGSWSDDTSMTIATMDSMNENKAIDYNDIMQKYLNWWNNGNYSSNSYPFGLGKTVSMALEKFSQGIEPINCGGKEIMDNGNGSLMRILPFSLYCVLNELSDDETFKIISEGSSITHGHEISIMACFIYTKLLSGAVKYRNPKMAYDEILTVDYKKYFKDSTIEAFKDILKDIFQLRANKINETGYVVDSLKAVIYSLLMGTSYESTIKRCIKLGYDTDTNACIVGSIAGIIYGIDDIPDNWIQTLKKKDYLEDIAIKFQENIKDIKTINLFDNNK